MTAAPPLIPLEHLFDNPEKAMVRISPDGTRLAYLAPEKGRLNVWVETIGEQDARPVTHDHVRGISFYVWSRDGKRIVYFQDQGGNENYHMFVADLAAPDEPAANRTPYENVRVIPLDLPRATPDKALVAMNRRNPGLFDPYRVDLETGDAERIAENPGDVIGWLTDRDGRLRCALAQGPTGDWQVRVRDGEDDEWRVLGDYSNADEAVPYAFTPEGDALWLATARDAEYKRLLRVDLATGEHTVVDAHPEADLENAVISDRTGQLLATAYVRDRLEVHPLDDTFARDWEKIRAIHHGDPHLTSADADENAWVVTFDDDRDPGATYVYRRDTGTATFVLRPRPWLKPEHLAPMSPVSFTARDGLRIRGYLTTPLGVEAKGLPVVLYVHGGPWARDMWGYEPAVQFFANRGYAVLQVNYRGSTGHGKAFSEAAVREFGRAMHDDLVDGVNWLVDQGVADPKRVAILGASYGGYAALCGLTFTPDVFACGVSLCGPSSLITLAESFPPYWRPLIAGTWLKYVGDPEKEEDRADMQARSPLNFVDRIVAPLLIGQGANDVRVTQKESDQIVSALSARGVDVEYVLKEDEGHGFQNPENRLDFFAAVERFLAKHLGGRSSAADA